jgi:hypothetical protein
MGVPARVISVIDPDTGERRRVDDGAQPRVADLPDPVLELIRCMQEKIGELEARLRSVEAGEVPERAPGQPASPAPPASRPNAHSGRHGARRPCGDQLERALRAGVAEREGGPADR